MTVLKAVDTKSANNLRNSSEFYPIHLDNEEYILTNEILLENVSEKTLKARDWYSPELHFLRFKGKRLELQCSYDKSSYKLSFIIEKNSLSVACGCCQQVEKICLHAYKVLSRLMHYSSKTSYFQDYAPKGLAKTAFANKKYFDFKNTNDGLEIRAKKQIGFVHFITNAKTGIGLQDVLKFPSKELSVSNTNHEQSLGYIILVPRKSYIIPFVLPFLSRYNKAHTDIKGFGKFLSGLEKEHEYLHTAEQKLLNEFSLELYKEVERIPNLFERDEETWEQKPQTSSKILEHWFRIFPLLQGQHVFTHTFWQHRYLKRGPQKSYTEKVNISLDVPELQFHLSEYARFFQLRIEILVKGTPVKDIESICSFLLKHEDTIYLLRSFKDAGIVEWFFSIDNKLTVFKEQFKDFENNYLRRLKENYAVHIKRLSRSKK
jgi:hypothetical protein